MLALGNLIGLAKMRLGVWVKEEKRAKEDRRGTKFDILTSSLPSSATDLAGAYASSSSCPPPLPSLDLPLISSSSIHAPKAVYHPPFLS
jgi:hypothetical protein